MKYFFWLLIIIFILAVGFFWSSKYFKLVSINGRKFIAETALTAEKQKKGLGERDKLGQNRAMLFEFNRFGQHGFWMKNMNFDLDILWISGDRIVYIAKNISHESLEIIKPKMSADKVLEINSGLSDKYRFEIGDEVRIY